MFFKLVRTQGLDPKRIYLTGYSKGGWMTDTLLQGEPGLAGGTILMGGPLPTPLKNPPAIDKKTAIFIGLGRLDPNYLPSLKALMHSRSLGLPVSFEAWAELGIFARCNGSGVAKFPRNFRTESHRSGERKNGSFPAKGRAPIRKPSHVHPLHQSRHRRSSQNL